MKRGRKAPLLLMDTCRQQSRLVVSGALPVFNWRLAIAARGSDILQALNSCRQIRMKFSGPKSIVLSLIPMLFLGVPVASAQDTILSLNYGEGAPCRFTTTSGVTIDGVTGQIAAAGQFDPASNCPSGGGATGTADADISASASTVNVNTSVDLSWSGVGDVCKYDGSSLPQSLTGWPATGDACVGASACGSTHTTTVTPTVGGTYKFKLTCISGAHGTQPQTTKSKTAEVTVTGAPPPSTECVAPSDMTRALTGSISYSGGSYPQTTDVTQWRNVYGKNLETGKTSGWPGISNNDIKITMGGKRYWSMEFTVPEDYPYYKASTQFPWGSWTSNETGTTTGVNWIVSITPECGNFTRPVSTSDPSYSCYQQYNNTETYKLIWKVAPAGQTIPGSCTLHRGETYFLNITPALLTAPGTSTCGAGTNCKINLKHTGSFEGTQGE